MTLQEQYHDRILHLDNYFFENNKEYKFENRLVNVFDIECDNIVENGQVIGVETYSICYMNCNEIEDNCYHNSSLKDFLNIILDTNNKVEYWYAHNGARYDFYAVLDKLLSEDSNYTRLEKQLTTISEGEGRLYVKGKRNQKKLYNVVEILYKDSKIYEMTVHNDKGNQIKFRDSCLMINSSLKDISKNFLNLEIPKDGLIYNRGRKEGYKLTCDEKRYVYTDVFALKYIIKQEFMQETIIRDSSIDFIYHKFRKMDYLTMGSLALDNIKHFILGDCINGKFKNNYSSSKLISMIENIIKRGHYSGKGKERKPWDNNIKQHCNDFFKEIFPMIFSAKQLNLEFSYDIFQSSYVGGLCFTGEEYWELNCKKKFPVQFSNINGTVIDINSMYPTQMYNHELPYNHPFKYNLTHFRKLERANKLDTVFSSDKHLIYFVSFTTHGDVSLKKGKAPCIRLRKCNTMSCISLKKDTVLINNKNLGDLNFSMTQVDFEMFKKNYNCDFIDINVVYGCYTNKGFFDSFIKYWYDLKKHGEGAVRQNAKLLLNSAYGKFGTKAKNRTTDLEFMDNQLVTKNFDTDSQFCFEIIDTIYVPLASFITAYARKELVSACEQVGIKNVLYCDTDSIHTLLSVDKLKCKVEKLDNDKTKDLGLWDIEGIVSDGIYYQQKRYAENIVGKGWDIKTAGLPGEFKGVFTKYIELFDSCPLDEKTFKKLFKDKKIELIEESINSTKVFDINDTTNHECVYYFVDCDGNKIPGKTLSTKAFITKGGKAILNTVFTL